MLPTRSELSGYILYVCNSRMCFCGSVRTFMKYISLHLGLKLSEAPHVSHGTVRLASCSLHLSVTPHINTKLNVPNITLSQSQGGLASGCRLTTGNPQPVTSNPNKSVDLQGSLKGIVHKLVSVLTPGRRGDAAALRVQTGGLQVKLLEVSPSGV